MIKHWDINALRGKSETLISTEVMQECSEFIRK